MVAMTENVGLILSGDLEESEDEEENKVSFVPLNVIKHDSIRRFVMVILTSKLPKSKSKRQIKHRG